MYEAYLNLKGLELMCTVKTAASTIWRHFFLDIPIPDVWNKSRGCKPFQMIDFVQLQSPSQEEAHEHENHTCGTVKEENL